MPFEFYWIHKKLAFTSLLTLPAMWMQYVVAFILLKDFISFSKNFKIIIIHKYKKIANLMHIIFLIHCIFISNTFFLKSHDRTSTSSTVCRMPFLYSPYLQKYLIVAIFVDISFCRYFVQPKERRKKNAARVVKYINFKHFIVHVHCRVGNKHVWKMCKLSNCLLYINLCTFFYFC